MNLERIERKPNGDLILWEKDGGVLLTKSQVKEICRVADSIPATPATNGKD